MTNYPEEVLDDMDDDGTMPGNVAALREAIVGRRIVSAAKEETEGRWGYKQTAFVISLDDGRRVALANGGDCCAYTDLESFLLHPERVDHVITGVGTTGGYTTWHIFADLGDVLELNVGWSCGNPFYYGYGFDIAVEEVADGHQ